MKSKQQAGGAQPGGTVSQVSNHRTHHSHPIWFLLIIALSAGGSWWLLAERERPAEAPPPQQRPQLIPATHHITTLHGTMPDAEADFYKVKFNIGHQGGATYPVVIHINHHNGEVEVAESHPALGECEFDADSRSIRTTLFGAIGPLNLSRSQSQ